MWCKALGCHWLKDHQGNETPWEETITGVPGVSPCSEPYSRLPRASLEALVIVSSHGVLFPWSTFSCHPNLVPRDGYVVVCRLCSGTWEGPAPAKRPCERGWLPAQRSKDFFMTWWTRLHAVPFFSLSNWETGVSKVGLCLSLAPVSITVDQKRKGLRAV